MASDMREPHEAAVTEITSAYSDICEATRCATVIQRAWRTYQDKRVFRYFRDLIVHRERCDPSMLLKNINPAEASLVDPAAGLFIRFRLGGFTFPPTIFYKIYTNNPIADIGSFAPRNYAAERRRQLARQKKTDSAKKKTKNTEEEEEAEETKTAEVPVMCVKKTDLAGLSFAGWYRRWENNGWRPITEVVVRTSSADLRQNDPLLAWKLNQAEREKARHAKAQPFHWSKLVRRSEQVKRKKARQRKWLEQLYLKKTKERFEEIDFEKEEKDILAWTEQLDFERYQTQWNTLATSSPADLSFVHSLPETSLDEAPPPPAEYIDFFGEPIPADVLGSAGIEPELPQLPEFERK